MEWEEEDGNLQKPSTAAGNPRTPVKTSYTWWAFVLRMQKRAILWYCKIKIAFTSVHYLKKQQKRSKNIEQKSAIVIKEDNLDACYFSLPELIATFLITCRC